MSDIVQDLSIFTGLVNNRHHPLSCICFKLQSSYLLVSIVYDGSYKLDRSPNPIGLGDLQLYSRSVCLSGLMANLRPPLELGEFVMCSISYTSSYVHLTVCQGSTKGEPNRASKTLLDCAFGHMTKMEIARRIVQVGGLQAATHGTYSVPKAEGVEETYSNKHLKCV